MTSNHIAEEIKRQRLAHGWTVTEAAERVDVDQSAWSRWEAGTTTPRPSTLRQLAALFDLPADWATVQHPSAMVDVSEFDERLERIEQRQAAILEQLKAEQLRVEQLLTKMMGGNGSGDERGPRDGVAADSDSGRPGGGRDR